MDRQSTRASHFVQVKQRVESAMAQVHKVRSKQDRASERRAAEAGASKWQSSR